MPAFNAAPYVAQALASASEQTYDHLEIIVVDDGSWDETAAIVSRLAEQDARITLLCQENKGVAAARNRALEYAKGAFVAPLDADDFWYPEKIARQVACLLDAGPLAGLAYSWWVVIDDEGRPSTEIRHPRLNGNVLEPLIRGNFVGNASVPLIRRRCLEHVGGYNPILCEDWELALRLAEHYDFRVVPACLVGYRKLSGRSLSTDFAQMARSYEWMISTIQARHPEIAPATYQASRAAFYLYLTRNSYVDGDHLGTLRWVLQVFRVQPSALCSLWVLIVTLTSVPAALARPIVAPLWPNRHTWMRFSRLWSRIKRKHRALSLPTTPPSAPAP